jgi:hypothetical protein
MNNVIIASPELCEAMLARNYAAFFQRDGTPIDMDELRDPDGDTMLLFLLKHATPDAWTLRDHIPYFLAACRVILNHSTFQKKTNAEHMDAWQLIHHRNLPHAKHVIQQMSVLYCHQFAIAIDFDKQIVEADVQFLVSKHLVNKITRDGTLLSIAIYRRRYALVKRLLDEGAICTPPYIQPSQLNNILDNVQYDIAKTMIAKGVLHSDSVRDSVLPYCTEHETRPMCDIIRAYYDRVAFRMTWLNATSIGDGAVWGRYARLPSRVSRSFVTDEDDEDDEDEDNGDDEDNVDDEDEDDSYMHQVVKFRRA